MQLLINLLDDMFFASIPAIGFGLVFNVPKRALKHCAILAALGHGARTFLVHFDVPLVFATFIAASLIGFIGVRLSHRYLAHPKVFTVAAIIPMIPGIYAYKAMIAFLRIHNDGWSLELAAQFSQYSITTTFILGALVFGLALPGVLFYRHKPVV